MQSVTNVANISPLFVTNIPGDMTAITVLVSQDDDYIVGNTETAISAVQSGADTTIGNIGVVRANGTDIFAGNTATATVTGEMNAIFQRRGADGSHPYSTPMFDPANATFSSTPYTAPVAQNEVYTFNLTTAATVGETYFIRIDNVTDQAKPSTNYRLDYVAVAGDTGAEVRTALVAQAREIERLRGEELRLNIQATSTNEITITSRDARTTFQSTNNLGALTTTASPVVTNRTVGVGDYASIKTLEFLGNKMKKIVAYPQSSPYENWGNAVSFAEEGCFYDIFTIEYTASQQAGSPYNGQTTEQDNRIVIACKRTNESTSGSLYTSLRAMYNVT